MMIDPLCSLCPKLAAHRRQVVQPYGPQDAEVVILGQNPGEQEDRTGVPFVGRAGKRKDYYLQECALLDPSKVLILNTVNCKSPKNRKPSKKEVAACMEMWVRPLLASMKPKLIVALGDVALKALCPTAKLSQTHGQALATEIGTVVPTYHPAAGIYDANLVPVMMRDWEEIGRLVRGERKEPLTWAVVPFDISRLRRVGEFAIDLETTSPEVAGKFQPQLAEITWVSVAWRERVPSGMPFTDEPIEILFTSVERVGALASLKPLLEDVDIRKVCHNSKFELRLLKRNGIMLRNFHDTKIAAYVLGRRTTGLKDLSAAELGVVQKRFEEVDWGDEEQVRAYSAADSACTLALWEKQREEIYDVS